MIDEASLYDRQIRLWGLEAQNRYVPLLNPIMPFSSRGNKLFKTSVDEGKEGKWSRAVGGREGKEDEKANNTE
jgi:hypothetical protein